MYSSCDQQWVTSFKEFSLQRGASNIAHVWQQRWFSNDIKLMPTQPKRGICSWENMNFLCNEEPVILHMYGSNDDYQMTWNWSQHNLNMSKNSRKKEYLKIKNYYRHIWLIILSSYTFWTFFIHITEMLPHHIFICFYFWDVN